MTTPNDGTTPEGRDPRGDVPGGNVSGSNEPGGANGAGAENPYGGYSPYPDNPAGSHPENGGSSAWPGTGSTSGYGSGQSDFGQNAYGEGAYEQSSYGADSFSQGAYGQNGYGQGGFDQFDVNSAAGAAGATALRYHGQQLTDGTYGDGATPHPINDPANNGWTHTKGTGKLSVMDALTWAFKTTFSNWKTWILFGVLVVVFTALSGVDPSGLLGLVSLFVYPVIASAGLQQTLSRTFGFKDVKTPAYGKTLGVLAVMGAIVLVLSLIVMVPTTIGIFSTLDSSTLPEDMTQLENDPEALFPLIGRLVGVIAVITVLTLLISPLITMPAFFAADNNGSFGDAVKQGFSAGARNYLPLLGLSFALGVMSIVGTLLALLGLIIVAPVSALAYAHAYRQISGGPVPSDEPVQPTL